MKPKEILQESFTNRFKTVEKWRHLSSRKLSAFLGWCHFYLYCNEQKEVAILVKKVKDDFTKDNARGRIGERIAEQFLSGIDFSNLQYFVPLFMPDNPGRLACRNSQFERWKRMKGYNENEDFHVTCNGITERHEIKTDYRCYSKDKNKFPTENIVIEVDANSIKNLNGLARKYIKKKVSKRGWFHPSQMYMADWYHFYLPLKNYDGRGRIISNMAMHSLTQEQISAFDNDEQIRDGDSIITDVPFDYIISCKGRQLKKWLEDIVRIDFNISAERSNCHILISIPVHEILKRIKREHDGESAVIPVCQFHTKGKKSGKGQCWVHEDSLIAIQNDRWIPADEFPIIGLRNSKGNIYLRAVEEPVLLRIQRVDLDNLLYQATGQYHEPFSTASILTFLPVYSPPEESSYGHNITR